MTDQPKVRPWVFLDNKFLDIAQAHVSVLDRGFLFGDSVYEVIPVHDGHCFALREHLQRLDRSLKAIGLEPPMTLERWGSVIDDLLQSNGPGDQSVYLQVTRGAAAWRNHKIPEGLTPTVLAFCQDLPAVDPEAIKRGAAAIILPDERWHHCDIKSTSLLGNVLLAREAARMGAIEAILHRDGQLTEGTSSNVFVVLGHRVITPPKSQWILPGITRELTLEAMQKLGIEASEEQLAIDTLRQANEIWITSSTRDIVAITRLDGQPVGSGQPGPVWQKVHQALRGTA